MNTLQQRLADYQNGGTFPDYQELMALAECMADSKYYADPKNKKEIESSIIWAVNEDQLPYPGMTIAFEKYYSQSWFDKDWFKETGIWAAAWKSAKAHNAVDEPQPVKYVDVKKIKSLCRKAFNFGQTYWYQADSEYVSNHKKADITMGKFNDLLNDIQELLAPHELKRLSDDDVESLLIDYNELILDRSHLSAPEAMQWIIRRVESKVRGEE